MISQAGPIDRIEKIRHFNRSYMQRIGVLSEKVFGGNYSLTEVRVLHELSLHESITATELCKILKLDGGYLSRILNGFEKNGLVSKERSIKDARKRKVSLTAKGRKVWAKLSDNARAAVSDMLAPLDEAQQALLVSAMATISSLLMFDQPA